MRLLVLGGTKLLGSAVVRTALDAGWHVTTLTRGLHGTPPPEVDARIGDRTTAAGLAALGDGEWDACVDTSGYVPRDVRLGARTLAGRVGRYVFVSTVNVYPDWPERPVTASSPVSDCPLDAGPDDGDYGYLKSGCERAVLESFPDATINRAGLIFGPRDNIARVSWWVQRVAAGGEVLAPGRPDQPLALIDARDMAEWMLAAPPGAFVVNSRAGTQTFESLLSTARDVTGSDARFTWVDDQVLLDAAVEPWTEMPLWLPASLAGHAWDLDVSAAYATGLRIRPLAESLADVWEWVREHGLPSHTDAERPSELERRLPLARERKILAGLAR
ncbi:NAD-dependent epimerase/dehydratase family protein [Cryptosporangium aurantiacum]|uniref:Nucleoside-diphosphate-sugar epimerase n=1 Tax=Cryptosporangium aurantiacum TaxID=134849 RepID=A0A1M7RD76_9ACTN|nr:NAD-dependent epimerase/dehydratase family protein [Cryptosporangium aurantiacum]SHN44140.1 Nucleoside-diphosphate-sugar epimerase [Cryptosporangium aurantiacum]